MDFYTGARELPGEEVKGPCTCLRTNLSVSLVMIDLPSVFTDVKFTINFSKIHLCLSWTGGEKENIYFCSSYDISWKTCEGAYWYSWVTSSTFKSITILSVRNLFLWTVAPLSTCLTFVSAAWWVKSVSQPMELRGYSDRSTETLSVLVFMLEDLTAPGRCNLHSLHLQHLRGAERAYGGDLALQGAQEILFCTGCNPTGGRRMDQKMRQSLLFPSTTCDLHSHCWGQLSKPKQIPSALQTKG